MGYYVGSLRATYAWRINDAYFEAAYLNAACRVARAPCRTSRRSRSLEHQRAGESSKYIFYTFYVASIFSMLQ